MASLHPPFKCSKAIFIPTRIHSHELLMYDKFKEYGYTIYTRGEPFLTLLNDIYEYVKKSSSEKRKSPSFCSEEGSSLGMDTPYLSDHILEIIAGNDVTTTVMCCYNEDNNQPYSILLYNYDEAKNSIYIESVCADQTRSGESKGSGGLLINNLIDAVWNSGKIKYIYLHAVPLAIKTYEKKGFIRTGYTHKHDDGMVEMNMTFKIHDVDDQSSEPSFNTWSPVYEPHSPEYAPGSPKPWGNISPVYKPDSPKPWRNVSPVYDPDSESKRVVLDGGRRSYFKTKKTKKRTCKTKKRNYKTKKRSNRSSSSKIIRRYLP